ncbi:MAG: flagellin [Aeromonadales bacterium]|nr:flagellin [Aeromonadales bacterium]
MGLFLTNTAFSSCTRYMSNITKSLDTVYKRLASGKRINSAKDDPAGFQIANRLTSQINGYKQGNRNINDGISYVQTMEGALDETVDMLQRIRTLAIQSANGTNSQADRNSINNQVSQLCEEITRIAKKTTFGGIPLLDGSRGDTHIQASGTAYDTIKIPDFSNGFTLSGLNTYLGGDENSDYVTKDGDVFRFTLSTAECSQNVLDNIDGFINAVTAYQGTLGGLQNRFESAIRLNGNMRVNLEDARSRIEDTDYAEEAQNLAQLNIQQQVCAMMMKQAAQSKNFILQLLQG